MAKIVFQIRINFDFMGLLARDKSTQSDPCFPSYYREIMAMTFELD